MGKFGEEKAAFGDSHEFGHFGCQLGQRVLRRDPKAVLGGPER